MSVLKRPENIDVPAMDNQKVAQELRDLAQRLGIDLSLANKEKTREILKGFKNSLSDEIVEVRKESYE